MILIFSFLSLLFISQSPATLVHSMATIFVPLPSTTTTTSVASLLPDLEAMLLKTGLGHLQPNTSDPRMREGIVVSPSLFVVQIQMYTSVMVHRPQSCRCISPHSFGVVGYGPRLVHLSISLSESIYLSFPSICSLFYLSSITSHRIRENCHHSHCMHQAHLAFVFYSIRRLFSFFLDGDAWCMVVHRLDPKARTIWSKLPFWIYRSFFLLTCTCTCRGTLCSGYDSQESGQT